MILLFSGLVFAGRFDPLNVFNGTYKGTAFSAEGGYQDVPGEVRLKLKEKSFDIYLRMGQEETKFSFPTTKKSAIGETLKIIAKNKFQYCNPKYNAYGCWNFELSSNGKLSVQDDGDVNFYKVEKQRKTKSVDTWNRLKSFNGTYSGVAYWEWGGYDGGVTLKLKKKSFDIYLYSAGDEWSFSYPTTAAKKPQKGEILKIKGSNKFMYCNKKGPYNINCLQFSLSPDGKLSVLDAKDSEYGWMDLHKKK